MGEVVFEVVEFAGDPIDPRFDEFGDASFEERVESFGEAIDDAAEDGGTTTDGEC